MPAEAGATWVSQFVSHDTEGSNLLLLRGMDHHHCGPQDAQQTTHFSMDVQSLIEEIRGEHGTRRTKMGHITLEGIPVMFHTNTHLVHEIIPGE